MATAIRSDQLSESPPEPCAWPAFDSMHDAVRGARATVASARHAAEELTAVAAEQARTHTVRTVAAAVATGAVVGSLLGFGCGWFARNRR